jgi:hypothetical protein
MAFKLKIKNKNTNPSAGNLDVAELGYNTSNTTLFVGNGASAPTEVVMAVGNQTIAGTKTFSSTINGNAATATASSSITVNATSTPGNFKMPFVNTTGNTTGNYQLLQEDESTFTYNPATNTLTAGTFSGALSGNAATVTTSADNTTNATRYVLFADAVSGSQAPKTDTGLTFNPSTDQLTVGSGTYRWTLDGSGTSFILNNGSNRFVLSSTGVISTSTWNGATIGVGFGGTGTSTAPTLRGVIFASSTSSYASTAAGTTGQYLRGTTSGNPVFSTVQFSEVNNMSRFTSTIDLSIAVTSLVGLASSGSGTRRSRVVATWYINKTTTTSASITVGLYSSSANSDSGLMGTFRYNTTPGGTTFGSTNIVDQDIATTVSSGINAFTLASSTATGRMVVVFEGYTWNNTNSRILSTGVVASAANVFTVSSQLYLFD